MTIKEAQELAEAWAHKHPEQDSYNHTTLNQLTADGSELIDGAAENNSELSQMLSNVMWKILLLANKGNIDLTSALIDNLERKNSHNRRSKETK